MHAISTREFPTKKSMNAIQKACDAEAIAYGDYHHKLDPIRFNDKVLASREKAEEWIKLNDSGWYDNLAIRFKDGRKIMWLVKYEYHC